MKPIFVRGVSSQFRLTLAIILSVALLMTNYRLDPVRQSLSSLLSPLQFLANVPGMMLDWSAEAFATRNMLELQNKELLRQQLVMSERLQRFEHVRQENERLRALLGSPVHMDSRKMVAEVMEVASDPFRQFVVLNHGLQNGVYVGQPVVDAKGVVVDLGDDIEGYLRASEISNDRVEDARNAYKEGDAVTAMVINVDRKARSIALSIKAKDQVDTDEAMKKIAEESAGSAGTTSLGALLKAKLGNNQ